MARKGATVQLQAELNTDEEFTEFLQKDGLLIIDVYQGWAGPCTGLLNTLRKAKIEIAGDKLQLAICDANLITKLKRFRNKCEPTMVFFSRGKVVDIVYGCDIPKLMTTILNQLEMEEKFNEGTIQRTFYEIEEPLPFECLVLDRIKAEIKEKARIAKDIADKELHENLKNIFSEMAESVNDMGVTLFMPHIAESVVKKTSETAKWSGMTIRAKKFINFTTNILESMKVYVENQMDDDILEYLLEKNVFAMLWGTEARTIVETVLGQFINNVTQPIQATDENDNEILLPSLLNPLVVYMDEEFHDEDNFSRKTDIPSEKSRKSTTTKETPRTSQVSEVSASESIVSVEEEIKVQQILIPDEDRPKLIIPPAWTPANREGTFFCLYTFFREQFESMFPPDKEEDPPHLCVSLPAVKRDEIFEVCDYYKGYLLEFGYFKGDKLEDSTLICKTTKKYEQIDQSSNDQLILKVSKKTSHLALALTTMSPTYVSLNTVDGAKECAILFNSKFQEVQDIIDTKVQKPKLEVKDVVTEEDQTEDQ